jgi:hypothetical protein
MRRHSFRAFFLLRNSFPSLASFTHNEVPRIPKPRHVSGEKESSQFFPSQFQDIQVQKKNLYRCREWSSGML